MDITNKNAGKIIENTEINDEHMKEYLKKWKNKDYMFYYPVQEDILDKIFKKYPKNNDRVEVWKKVTLVDSYYSTNLKEGIWDAVLNITKLENFDEEVKKGNWEVVDNISSVFRMTPGDENTKSKDVISFSSKYCSRINPDGFPIYDKYVRQMLVLIQKKHPFLEDLEKWKINSMNGNYENFVYVMKAFCTSSFFNKEINYKDADRYLWTWAKEIIQNQYRIDKINYYSNNNCNNKRDIENLLNNIFPVLTD